MEGRYVLQRIALLAIAAPRRIIAIALLVMVACGIFGIPVAKHLSAQKFVRAKQPFDAAKAQRAVAVYKLRCEKCHEDNGSSPDEDNGLPNE